MSLCAYILLTVYSLSSDPSQSDSDSKDFWFNMQALTFYLRKASDQNPSASYYNVDILKYQVSQPASDLEHNKDKITVKKDFPYVFPWVASLRKKQKMTIKTNVDKLEG